MDGDGCRDSRLADLKRLLSRFGVTPNRARGQNFLCNLGLLGWIAEQADLHSRDVVLEIGGGTGSLTHQLAERSAMVVVVEIDAGLVRCLRSLFRSSPAVRIVAGDVLESKHALHPRVRSAIRDAIQAHGQGNLKCVANLPYSVAVPAMVALLESGLPFERLVVTVQKEIAERILACPGTRDYGAATVVIRSHASARALRVLRPGVFWPAPKVHSSVVLVTPYRKKQYDVGAYGQFVRLVQGIFRQRRKKVSNGLVSAVEPGLSAPAAREILERSGVDPDLRGDQLGVEQFAALSREMSRHSA